MSLDGLVNEQKNIYEVMSAVIKRANQISDIRAAHNFFILESGESPASEKHVREFGNEKAVSIALRELYSNDITYSLEKERE